MNITQTWHAGWEDCLNLSKHVALVLDIHHHWVREGEYIQPNDRRVEQVKESWRGLRPTMHYSLSREDYLVDHSSDQAPDKLKLLEQGYMKSKLRAHSDFYWNTATNDWALSFLDGFDIMCESKAKNLASFALAERAKHLAIL